ncbi:LysR family transcriptional regulator [Methyloferula stellata]|uniref:LysR family transcriptional regulator n=1 Tax=Methyloferula stellata TaxID=876270 RepID=UPI00047C8E7A|nr:LysR family transcriptional regulator [Methyloferula stellata]
MADMDLADLDAFVAVAQARSFRGAAKLRGVSPSSLSEALRRLELRLGVRLLNRTTRSVTPTEAGAHLLERLAPALGDISGALDAVNQFRDSPRGTLKLNVPTIVAREILPPIATRFLIAHPGITLDVTASDTFIDVLAAGFDAGIRYDERIEKDMIAVPIGPSVQRFVLAASPAYIAARGAPKEPREILDHPCIRHRFLSGVLISTWEFERDGEIVRVSPEGPMIATMGELEIGAALAGLGLIYSFEEFLRPYLDKAELVELLADWSPRFPGPFLYYPSRKHMPAPLRAFVDFIKTR